MSEEWADYYMHKRQCQLVAREGMLALLLDTYNFPTDNHRRIIELIYEETLDEMESLGLELVEEEEGESFGPDPRERIKFPRPRDE